MEVPAFSRVTRKRGSIDTLAAHPFMAPAIERIFSQTKTPSYNVCMTVLGMNCTGWQIGATRNVLATHAAIKGNSGEFANPFVTICGILTTSSDFRKNVNSDPHGGGLHFMGQTTSGG